MIHVLRNAEVFAPEPLGRADLVVGGGKLLFVGEHAPALPAALGSVETDLEGLRLVPGLVDAHVHLTGGGGEAGFRTRVPPLALSALTTAGVTSVVGLLGTDDVARTTGELVATARALCEEGLSAWCWTGGYHVPPTTLTGSVRGDIVHVDRIVGAGEIAISDHRSSQPTFDELLRLAADCHVAGLMTGKAGVLHLHLGDGERGLALVRRALEGSELPPRTFHPTHVNRLPRLFDEACELAARGVTVDVTAFPTDDDDPALSAADAIARYLDADLPPERLTASSDGGGCLPSFDGEGRVRSFDVGTPALLAATLRELLERGLPLADALPPFTSNPAALLRLAGKGRIAAGLDADLVALDPSGAVSDVMVGGAWHVRVGEPIVRGTFEPA